MAAVCRGDNLDSELRNIVQEKAMHLQLNLGGQTMWESSLQEGSGENDVTVDVRKLSQSAMGVGKARPLLSRWTKT